MASKLWVGLGVVWLGCGGGGKEANAPACGPGLVFDGRQCQAQGGPTATPTPPAPGGGGSGAGVGTPPPAPAPLPLATTSCSSPVAPIDASAAQPAVALLAPLVAQKAMPGAKPLGAVTAAQLQQGQCFEATISMSPGKCYSVVAVALPTLQNLDLALVPTMTLPGVPLVVAAADNSVGASAVIGAAPDCFKWAWPVAGTMKLIVAATAGQGLAAAQVFEK